MKKIILVESEPTQINIYRRLFKKTDFDVELASSKDEMIEEMRDIRVGNSDPPDLIIMELALADGHGIEVLKAIKKHILTKNIPVFAITNYKNPDIDREIKQLGIEPEKYLIKATHTPAQLLGIVSQYLGQSDQIRTTLS